MKAQIGTGSKKVSIGTDGTERSARLGRMMGAERKSPGVKVGRYQWSDESQSWAGRKIFQRKKEAGKLFDEELEKLKEQGYKVKNIQPVEILKSDQHLDGDETYHASLPFDLLKPDFPPLKGYISVSYKNLADIIKDERGYPKIVYKGFTDIKAKTYIRIIPFEDPSTADLRKIAGYLKYGGENHESITYKEGIPIKLGNDLWNVSKLKTKVIYISGPDIPGFKRSRIVVQGQRVMVQKKNQKGPELKSEPLSKAQEKRASEIIDVGRKLRNYMDKQAEG